MQTGTETLTLLTFGFALVILVYLIVVVMLWIKTKVKAYAWFLAQGVLLIIAFFKLVKLILINFNISIAVILRDNSLTLDIIGVLWSCSMLCILIGIFMVSRKKTKGEVADKAKEEYTPSLTQALGALLFYGLLCPIVLSLVTYIAAKAIGFSEYNPLVYVATTLAQFGLLVMWLKRKYIINFKSFFSLEKTRAIFFIPMALTILGSGILLSEVGNFVTRVLPMNAFWLKVFNNFLGNGASTWGLILAIVVTAPIVEEIIFRGLLLKGFLKHYSVRKSILLSALLFGIIHMNPWQFVTAFATGIILGWWHVKTGSIVTTIFGHALNNGIVFIISAIGIIIPGYNSPYNTVQHQPLWFDFLGIILLILGVMWLVKLFNTKHISFEDTMTSTDGSNL